MNGLAASLANFAAKLEAFALRLLDFVPELLAAVALLAAGWLAGFIARKLVVRLSVWTNRLLDRLFERGRIARYRINDPLAQILGSTAFWIMFIVFAALAADAIGFSVFGRWLGKAIEYMPLFLTGAVIVVAGIFASEFARRLVAASAATAGVAQSALLGRAAQIAILVAALIVGLDQIQIDVNFLIVIVAVVVGAILGGLSLAFGLGARTHASNIIGAHYVGRDFRLGQKVRFREIEGTIIEIKSTTVVMATESGKAFIPARLFVEEVIQQVEVENDNA